MHHYGLNDPVNYAHERYVRPKVATDHKMYRFWIQAATESGSNSMFGDFNLWVGCMESANKVTDAFNFTTSVALVTAANDTSVYELAVPISSLSWCVPQKHEIVDINGKNWVGDVKLVASSSHCGTSLDTCTHWNLVNPLTPDYFLFRVRTTYPGNNIHLSQIVQLSNQEVFSDTVEKFAV